MTSFSILSSFMTFWGLVSAAILKSLGWREGGRGFETDFSRRTRGRRTGRGAAGKGGSQQDEHGTAGNKVLRSGASATNEPEPLRRLRRRAASERKSKFGAQPRFSRAVDPTIFFPNLSSPLPFPLFADWFHSFKEPCTFPASGVVSRIELKLAAAGWALVSAATFPPQQGFEGPSPSR